MGFSWHKISASSKTGKLCTTHFICGNLVLSQRLTDPILADVVSRQFRAAYWLITTKLIHMSWSEILPSLIIDARYPSVAILLSLQFRAAYWLITTKTLVVDGIFLTQSFSFLKDREIMYHSLYMGNLVLSQRLTDPILADVVSRQFKAAYWLITTKLIHMSWSEILPSLVILNLFTFELRAIDIFLPNSVLMLYIRRWPS